MLNGENPVTGLSVSVEFIIILDQTKTKTFKNLDGSTNVNLGDDQMA